MRVLRPAPGPLRALLRRLGKDLAPYPPEDPGAGRLQSILDGLGVTLVFDVGANVGQYAKGLRRHGYRGRIVSFEPVAGAHAKLAEAAGADPKWIAAPRTAVGGGTDIVAINISNRTDMSSALAITEEALRALPKSFTVGREEAPQVRLDAVFGAYAGAGEAAFLKVDTQGYERRVLEGAAGVMDRLSGVQLELSLRPLYAGEAGYLELADLLATAGFEPVLILPGYFSKRLGRQLQIDMVFARRQ